MTRINTNVSSLTAQQNLQRSNVSLQTALTRLSTGLRINSGKDDPAGMIAAAQLGSDIASSNQAISNTKAAEAMIDTADTSLSQVTTLLNEVRALVVQTANDATMSDEQITANQAQIDSAMDAIDRIAQTTNYQGRKLLDGSMDFIYSDAGTGGISMSLDTSDVLITQANLSAGDVTATVRVTTEATEGKITTAGLSTAAAAARVTFDLATDIVITAADNGSEWNGFTVTFTLDAVNVVDGQAVASYNSTAKTLDITYNNSTVIVDNTALDNAISAVTTDFAIGATGEILTTESPTTGTTALGTDGGISGAVAFELSGNEGSKTFQFASGTTGLQIQDAVNLLTTSTGVTATWTAGTHTLDFESSEEGSSKFVQIDVISDATNLVGGKHEFTNGFALSTTGQYDTGADIIGKINGYTATGVGNTLSINTSALAIAVTMLNPASTTLAGKDLVLTISGGGALFQLGPDINSNNQANMGIQSVSTGTLGGVDGRLFQLITGGTYSLTGGDLNTSTKIVDEALVKLTSLRGRLGAFEKATLETNADSLANTVTALTSAQSDIQDADFAAETANLTRSQILVQSGTAVLKIANQNPQNVLALLQ